MEKTLKTDYFYLMNSKQIKEEEITSGATKFNDQWITNYQESDMIEIKDNNELSIYVPSTIDVDKINENIDKTIEEVKNKIKESTKSYKTNGAWRTEEGTIVFEEITILSIDVNKENFENKLNEFIIIAEEMKKELKQEGISIGINNGLMII
jgi:PII-like signaling protein